MVEDLRGAGTANSWQEAFEHVRIVRTKGRLDVLLVISAEDARAKRLEKPVRIEDFKDAFAGGVNGLFDNLEKSWKQVAPNAKDFALQHGKSAKFAPDNAKQEWLFAIIYS